MKNDLDMTWDDSGGKVGENAAWEDGMIVPIFEDTLDRYGWEKMFHALPQEQLEVLVCLYLGLKPTEIVTTLGYPNIVRYYNVSSKLRKMYKERKKECLDYN